MSFSSEVLANIKTPMDSDESEEDIHRNPLLKVLKSFPETSTEIVSFVGENLRSENFKEEAGTCVDPLFNNIEDSLQNYFTCSYQDNEIFKTDESDDETNEARQYSKVSRPEKEFASHNGFLWHTSRNVAGIEKFQSAIQLLQPRGKGPAHTINSILEMWSLLVDDQIVSQIVKYTNIEIKQKKLKMQHQRVIDAVELRSWIGLNYLCGIFRNATHKGPLDELWSMELGNSIFRCTMSFNRFKFICESMRFGETPIKDKKYDAPAILDLWDMFMVNCRSYYAPGGNCAVDEVEINYMRLRDESRLLLLCDAKTSYMCNGILNLDGEYKERDILRLVSDMKGSKRNIVLPKKFTSIELLNKLLGIDISSLGILANTAMEIPPDFQTNGTFRKLYSDSMCLILNHQNKNILLASGMPKNIKVEHLYNLSCNVCRDFSEMRLNGDSSMKQRDFQRRLGLYLTQQQLKRQLHSNRISLSQKVQISEVLGENIDKLFPKTTAESRGDTSFTFMPNNNVKVPDGVKLFSKNLNKRSNCRKCPSKISRKTKTRCQQCLRPLCQRHYILRCCDCTGVTETEEDTPANAKRIVSELSASEIDEDDNDME
ncbi:uncharacterized protein LOC101451606 isoform X3 [Ceratitis capitata]|uniref:uncharacterized protein LOC101451606 isoform X3 n=1 Tax=Ceratitis capitata TaxID=7213 RepID=UPI000A114DD3|nr:uncharacterized protein LOC101451606 isoform X3 [Ceratitis capitata]